MTESSKTICQWGDATFGQVKSVKAYAIRAQEELTELIEAIDDTQSSHDIMLEAARRHNPPAQASGHIGPRSLCGC